MTTRQIPTSLRLRFAALACALGAAGIAPAAFAQSSEVASANVRACAASGSVSLTVLGLTTTLPLPCAGEALRTAPGRDDTSAASIDLSLLGIVGLLKVGATQQEAIYTHLPGATALDGASQAAGLSLVQDLVTIEGVRGELSCDSLSGNSVVQCDAGTRVARVRIAGGDLIDLPAPIPRNFSLPVGGTLRLTVLGIPIEVPVGGALTLNRSTVFGVGTRNVFIAHQPVQLGLEGRVDVAGLGLVGVRVEAVTSPSSVGISATRAVSGVQIDDL
ncbi:hypothetical protein K4L06_15875 [Lysobacter sp. BMK333-48F3]|uniref:choice-of-anchor P family protein n=1 Tax=Lysobacter sp. BMK333-48F3 TaxID=2867962 RepID=UPI001C8B2D21|nr:choice-of-anchor P family protein [Lysobacter sp. BMK333-48F3]MBX9402789.1 hypothetical protein [Lysobacter sp. BMK333-48F3]